MDYLFSWHIAYFKKILNGELQFSLFHFSARSTLPEAAALLAGCGCGCRSPTDHGGVREVDVWTVHDLHRLGHGRQGELTAKGGGCSLYEQGLDQRTFQKENAKAKLLFSHLK